MFFVEPLDYVDEKEDLILGMGKRDRVYSVDFEANCTNNGDQILPVNWEDDENSSNGDQEEITLGKEVPSDIGVSQTMKAR